MKQLLIILSLVLGCLQPGYTQKPVLKFNKDGKFKIVQFTDVHYIHGNPSQPFLSNASTKCWMRKNRT